MNDYEKAFLASIEEEYAPGSAALRERIRELEAEVERLRRVNHRNLCGCEESAGVFGCGIGCVCRCHELEAQVKQLRQLLTCGETYCLMCEQVIQKGHESFKGHRDDCPLIAATGAEAVSDAFLKWLDEAGKHWDTVRPEDVMRELGRTDERDKRDERIRELEAQCAAMRAAFVAYEEALDACGAGSGFDDVQAALQRRWDELRANALASDAGKALLERLAHAEAVAKSALEHAALTRGELYPCEAHAGLRRACGQCYDSALVRLEKAEKEARRFHEWLHSAPIVKEARAQAFEQAAEVAKSYEPPDEDSDIAAGIAAAIRALAKEGT